METAATSILWHSLVHRAKVFTSKTSKEMVAKVSKNKWSQGMVKLNKKYYGLCTSVAYSENGYS